MNSQTSDSARDRALNFAREVQAGFLATSENNIPYVRGVLMWRADDSGLYFHTAKTKDLYRQLQENPVIEIAFYSPHPEPVGTMMRVNGKIEFLEDSGLKRELIKDRPWLLSYGEIRDDSLLAIFKIKDAKAKFWTNESNMKEREADLILLKFDS